MNENLNPMVSEPVKWQITTIEKVSNGYIVEYRIGFNEYGKACFPGFTELVTFLAEYFEETVTVK